MNLIIVESPTKAATITRFLGKGFRIDSTMGHVRDLPENKLGIDIAHNFRPQYIVLSDKQETIEQIKKDAKKANKIFLATDPDREGEAIAYHVAYLLTKTKGGKIDKTRIFRIVFHEITKPALLEALGKAGKINLKLVRAQQARRVLDRLVGYTLSPLLWKKVRRGLSAGRVQSVAVRLIVDREREIEKFQPRQYWEIFVHLRKKDKDISFFVRLIKIDDKRQEIKNKKQADQISAQLKKGKYYVSDVSKKTLRRSPAPPFTTSTMAQTANRRFGWSSKKTMAVAQRLYEKGLITYHRTDSTNLAKQAVAQVRSVIKEKFGGEFLPFGPRVYKTKSKLAQEAHEAIRPTNPYKTADGLKFDKDAAALYDLIWKRFVACQMADALLEQTTVEVKSGRYLFSTSGRIVKFNGWAAVYEKNAKALLGEGDQELPSLSVGEELMLVRVEPQQKFTQPPPRYTEATLVRTLEKLGIGRPSTYAPIISTIQTRQYVEKEEGKFKPTALGIAVVDFLTKHFPDILDYGFTAQMEDELDDIAKGERKWVPVVEDFWSPFVKKLRKVERKAGRVRVKTEKTGRKCPKCGKGDEIVRVGRFGRFLSCSRFPKCDYTDYFVEKVGIKCPECGQGEIIVRRTKKERKFYGCSRFPKCKFASWKKPAKTN